MAGDGAQDLPGVPDPAETAALPEMPEMPDGAAAGEDDGRDALYRTFRASSLFGLASAMGTLVGLIRSKAFAIFLGTGGVGLAGLYFSLMQVASVLAGLGLNISVVRELSKAGLDRAGQARVRRAAVALALGLGGLCALGVWLLRGPIAAEVVGDPSRAAEVGWLALGAGAMVAAAVVGGILQGLRATRAYAVFTALAALPGTLAAILLAALWGAEGVFVIVLCVPVLTAAAGFALLRRIPAGPPAGAVVLARPAAQMLGLGAVLMLSVILQQAAMLYMRSHVTVQSGLHTAGLFHSAWLISAVSMGLALQALGADFFPRLTRIIEDHGAAVAAMNQALLVALIIATPMVIGGIGGAWLALTLFFSADFTPAAPLLVLFSFGNLFRIMSVTLAYAVLSRGRRFQYLGLELLWAAVFLAVTLILYGRFGLTAVGLGYLAAYAARFTATFTIARRVIGFSLAPRTRLAALMGFALSLVTALATLEGDWAGLMVGIAAALVSLGWGLRVLSGVLPDEGRLAGLLRRLGLRRRPGPG